MTSIINASTTAGVIITSDTSGNLALQTGGGTYTQTVPNATGTLMVSGNMPAFSAYQSTAQTGISSWTATKMQLQTKEFDTANCFDNTTNYRFTPTVAGYYQISAGATIPYNSTTGYLIPAIYKNGSLYKFGATTNGFTNAFATSVVSALVYCNGSTDYIELYVTATNNGGSWQSWNGQSNTYMTGVLVRTA